MADEEKRTLIGADIPTVQKLHTAIAAIQPSAQMTLFQQRRLLYLCLRLQSEIDTSIWSWLLEDVESAIADPQVWNNVDTELGIPESHEFPHPIAHQDAGIHQDE